MYKLYVNKRLHLSNAIQIFKSLGAHCYRVRTQCNCVSSKGADNRRDGILVIHNDQVVVEVIRCRNCAKSNNTTNE